MKTGFRFLLILLLGACAGDRERGNATEVLSGRIPSVYTVNYPLAWMAGALGGERIEVVFPVPSREDPAFWQPDVEAVLRYQQADLVLLNGANYAAWVAKVSLPGATMRDTSREYHDRLIAVNGMPEHSHGPEGEHSHGNLAFTTWLDLELAQLQLRTVAEAIEGVLPPGAAGLQGEVKEVQKRLAELDDQMMILGRSLDGAPLLYSHPVYQYLQRRYGFNGRAVHWEPDQMPDEQQWHLLDEILQSHPARLMLWEAAPLPAVSARLEGLGIEVIVFEPAGNRPPKGDFITTMASNIAALSVALAH